MRRLSRLQVALGLAWIVDGLLQLQPANRGASFAGTIADGAMGQPAWAQSMVLRVASVFAAHPLAGSLGVALVQIALGVAIVVPRTRRSALLLSVPWALGVWVLGEALGNLATGFAMLPTGGPGPALLYVLAAVIVLPRSPAPGRAAQEHPVVRSDDAGRAPAHFGALGERTTALLWGLLWCGGAVLQAIPVETLGFKLSANFQMASLGEPGLLAAADRGLARFSATHGPGVTAALIATELAVGAAAIANGPGRAKLLELGLLACLVFWVIGEDLGGLFTGSAVDVGAMPLYALIGLALLPARRSQRSAQPVWGRGTSPRRTRLSASPACASSTVRSAWKDV
jgi:hypothetical protein